ncbi:flagellar hook-associated protein FlgK [Caldinitratiruptor microaerophilus]|uniref:Flagellar hook-associated protein 1 n=1 Tax=Caldinitratiruptor microaerophilus TaxID=671077 RepID=A0AA35GAW5_9FIRM|nr:flagellar hook-associated protein FlgK [Caldinitratiruptor microaerophilus]BDG61744.1 flagellar hook-associated protein 1 [Caldinitratiruptor microaerophilus]
MPSPWLGIEIGLGGLRANQRALEITGHNIANVHTEGYSRQSPVFETTPALDYPVASEPGQIGTGVHIARTNRYREMFLDLQYRKHSANYGYSKTLVDFYDQLEGVWQEPSDYNLRAHLDRFWDALQDLANRPGAYDARVTVIESGKALVQVAKSLHQQMEDLGKSLEDRIQADVTELNRMANDVAQLNEQIARVQAQGQTAHDLEDKRDLLLDQMAAMAGVRWELTPAGRVTVYIGTHRLVNGAAAVPDPVDEVVGDATGAQYVLKWSSDSSAITLTSGELAATLEARNVLLPYFSSKLDTLVSVVAGKINWQHSQGWPQSGDFFRGVNPKDPNASPPEEFTLDWNLFDVDPDIESDPWQIAAAASGPTITESDGENARKMAALFDAALSGLDNSTVGEYYRATEADLGVRARKERSVEETLRIQVQQVRTLRDSTSGVTLDEEVARMIQYQQAFGAAARLITTVDEMLDKLINGTGAVGR